MHMQSTSIGQAYEAGGMKCRCLMPCICWGKMLVLEHKLYRAPKNGLQNVVARNLFLLCLPVLAGPVWVRLSYLLHTFFLGVQYAALFNPITQKDPEKYGDVEGKKKEEEVRSRRSRLSAGALAAK